MGLFDNFPYSNFHEINLDWLLQAMKNLDASVREYMAVNKVGYGGVWDIEKQYPAYTVVSDGNHSYISLKPVPAGVAIDNEDYWQLLADLDPRIAPLIEEVDILREGFFNVKNFGAVGDGVTDDTAAVKTALSYGGAYFPAGTYRLTSSVDIPSNRKIWGVGKIYSDHAGVCFRLYTGDSATFIKNVIFDGLEMYSNKSKTNTTAISIVQAVTVSGSNIFNVAVRNMYIHGFTLRGVNTFGGGPGTKLTHGYPFITIENCILEDIGEIALCNSGVTVHIRGCRISHAGIDEAITVDNGCLFSEVSGCKIISSGGGAAALSFDETDDLVITNNYIQYNGSRDLPAISFNCNSGNCDNVFVANNYFRTTGSADCKFGSTSYSAQGLFTGNRFSNQNPINVVNSGYLNISGNIYPSDFYNNKTNLYNLYNAATRDCDLHNLNTEVDSFFKTGFTPTNASNKNYVSICGNVVQVGFSFTKTSAFADGDIPLQLPFRCRPTDIILDSGTVLSVRPNGEIQIYGVGYTKATGTFQRTITFIR